MKIFYSHHCYKYGTPIEEYEMELIRGGLAVDEVTVINPKDVLVQGIPESIIMENSFAVINGCDALVFSTVSGMIGRGVFDEVIYALNHGKPVYEIYGDDIIEIEGILAFESRIYRLIFNGDNRRYAVLYPPDALYETGKVKR